MSEDLSHNAHEGSYLLLPEQHLLTMAGKYDDGGPGMCAPTYEAMTDTRLILHDWSELAKAYGSDFADKSQALANQARTIQSPAELFNFVQGQVLPHIDPIADPLLAKTLGAASRQLL
jgi:hypothetical protein